MAVHKGQSLRSKVDPTWPTITITSVWHNPTRDGFRGHVLRPFATVTWADGEVSNISLVDLERNWEDTGV